MIVSLVPHATAVALDSLAVRPSDIVSVMMTLHGRVWTLWQLVTTVNLAFLGWLISRTIAFSKQQRVVATIGYAAFVALTSSSFVRLFAQLGMAVTDLVFALKSTSPGIGYASLGLVAHLSSASSEYQQQLMYVLLTNAAALGFFLVLIWWRTVWQRTRA